MKYFTHPCYSKSAKGRFGRVHLPIAPKCNIQCNYCNRKYDCVNESRPGVTSTVLSPGQALYYLEQVIEKEPRITVAGIAGPGDPFANPEATLETLSLIRERFPDLILCMASNGLGMPPYIDRLEELEVSHITITVNAVDPAVGKKIYAWVRDGKTVYRGHDASELLLTRQLEVIRELKRRNFTVKVNTIVIQGTNDHHIKKIAQVMGLLEVDVMNCIPMYPSPETPFCDISEPSQAKISFIRRQASAYVPQIDHCTRCRADAVGLLNEDRTEEFRGCISACSALPLNPQEDRPYVAVASYEGMLVNQHLGQATQFLIFEQSGEGFTCVQTRSAPPSGGGRSRWQALAHTLKDCRAVLVSGIGDTPRIILEKAGIRPVEMYGFIEEGLIEIFQKNDADSLKKLKGRRISCTQAVGCSGCGTGCD